MAPTPPSSPAAATATSLVGAMAGTPVPVPVPVPLPSHHRPPRSDRTAGALARLAGEPSRQEAFDSAKKKFAMYGKLNAHVSHYSPDLTQTSARARHRQKRRATDKATATTTATTTATATTRTRRAVDGGDDDAETGRALQNTVLLQENGELAAQLDDVEYHLDGILEGARGVETDERAHAMASSVVALTVLLQMDQVQTAMRVAQPSGLLMRRLRQVLLRLKTYEHRMLKLAVAAMAFTLTLNDAQADEIFTEDVIDGVVAALAIECQCLEVGKTGADPPTGSNDNTVDDSKAPLKKSFLKRKKIHGIAIQQVAPVVGGNNDQDDGDAIDDNDDKTLKRARAQAQREEPLQAKLRSLLKSHDVFMVDGQVQLSTADLLCMVLHNILQVGGASGGDTVESSPSHLSTQRPGRQFRQHQDLAGTAFATITARKKQLIANGGLELLLSVLGRRFNHLFDGVAANLCDGSVSLQLVLAFQRLRTILRVLDQASFLSTDVQQEMSMSEVVFRVSLKLIEELSNLAWSVKSRKKWQNDSSFMQLVVDVLMSAMRVLINLSHQNEDANKHIASLEGTRSMFVAFCQLWGTVLLEQTNEGEPSSNNPGVLLLAGDKVVYDTQLLMLSAITNCVEYSDENRSQLSKIDFSEVTLDGLELFRSQSPCTLLVSFFVSKIQSYIHLFEMSDSQREMEEESWVPEDVVLGGCTSLLLGCLMKNSASNSAIILDALPDASPQVLLRALSAFVALHSQIGALTPEVGKSVLEVEQLLKSLMGGDDNASPNPVRWSSASLIRVPAKITVKLNTASLKSTVFEVEKVHSTVNTINEESSQHSLDRDQAARSPPASAFKFQRFSRVCSNVDDSDEAAGEDDASFVSTTPAASASTSIMQSPRRVVSTSTSQSPKRRAVTSTLQSPTRTAATSTSQSPGRRTRTSTSQSPARRTTTNTSQSPRRRTTTSTSPSPRRAAATQSPKRAAATGTAQSPRRAKSKVSAKATLTPERRATGRDSRIESGKEEIEVSSLQRRKRTRDLRSELETALEKIESDASMDIPFAGMVTSTEHSRDDFRDRDWLDMSSSLKIKIIRRTPPKAKIERQLPVKIPRVSAPITNPAPTPATLVQPRLITHKRKQKATPVKPSNSLTTEDDADAVFEFTG